MAKTVLIVEDYADVRELMNIYLRKFGYQVINAVNGREAIEIAKQHHLDLILMDLSMPGMDGLTAVKIIRDIDGLATVPIIAFTSYGDFYSDEALKAGCNAVIDKLYNVDELEGLLKKYIE